MWMAEEKHGKHGQNFCMDPATIQMGGTQEHIAYGYPYVISPLQCLATDQQNKKPKANKDLTENLP